MCVKVSDHSADKQLAHTTCATNSHFMAVLIRKLALVPPNFSVAQQNVLFSTHMSVAIDDFVFQMSQMAQSMPFWQKNFTQNSNLDVFVLCENSKSGVLSCIHILHCA